MNFYDNTLYNFLKNNIKPFTFETFYTDTFKDIEIILNKTITDEMKKELNINHKITKIKDLLIYTIENDFNQYMKIINYFKLDLLNYGTFNIYEKLLTEGKIDMMLDLNYDDELNDDTFNLIYRQTTRRSSR